MPGRLPHPPDHRSRGGRPAFLRHRTHRGRLAFLRHRSLALGAGIAALLVLTALLSQVWLPHDVEAIDIDHRLQPPSAGHPFGTDHLGRDIFSRVLAATGTALGVGLVSLAVALVLGVALGAAAGLRGGWVDEVLMRLADALYAFPGLLFALLTVAALGPGIFHAMLAIGISAAPVFARLTRAGLISLRQRAFVEAARAVGAGRWRLFTRHLLPNAAAPLIVQSSVTMASAILAEAALSFLGLGTQPPAPSWGRMLEEAQAFLTPAPWFGLFPGLFLALAVLGFNLLGDGLRDLLDPQTNHRG
ncbi:MAG TPA: ABC transporter permease [Bacillota bacterium]